MENKKFGLIGRNISYSFSKIYFEEKFKKLYLAQYTYSLFDISTSAEIAEFLKIKDLAGFNVTQPYKQKIIPFLDDLSVEAEEIGAVNTVLVKNGKRKGYNTDAFGFEQTIVQLLQPQHRSALILGNGGASKAVQFVLKKLKIDFKIVERSGILNFENLSAELVNKNLIIIQCTPIGTFPLVEEQIHFPFFELTEDHLVIDLIYNPIETKFLRSAAEYGAVICNGMHMLEQQAEKSWQIWNS